MSQAETPGRRLRWMQATQPWTAPYSKSFCVSRDGLVGSDAARRRHALPEEHRHAMHDLMHITKATGILASICEAQDHGRDHTDRVPQAEYEGRIADLVMCALHLANNPPEGYVIFDLERAVTERTERVNGQGFPLDPLVAAQ